MGIRSMRNALKTLARVVVTSFAVAWISQASADPANPPGLELQFDHNAGHTSDSLNCRVCLATSGIQLRTMWSRFIGELLEFFLTPILFGMV